VPAKVNIRALLTKHLGKEVGDAMAAKMDKMIRAKKSAAQIERAILADLVKRTATQVTAAIPPAAPPPLSGRSKNVETRIGICSKVGTQIKVHAEQAIQVGPGPLRKGPK
jgi:hypothetical protein